MTHAGINPPTVADEGERLESLYALRILDTPPEERFDRITRTASRLFGVPIALVSFVDANRQWFKSCVGLDIAGTDRASSFCAHALAAAEMLVIEDAPGDPRFSENPSVAGSPYLRFYAGQPLAAPDGRLVGTLCVLDDHPRAFSDEEKGALRDLASWAELELNSTSLSAALAARRESDARVQAIMANVDEAIMLFDEGAQIVEVNPAAEAMFEVGREVLIGRPIGDFIDAFSTSEDRQGTEVEHREGLRERVGRRANGEAIPLDLSVAAVELDGADLTVAVARDTSESRHARQEYQRLQRSTELILESAGEGIFGLDNEGRASFVNGAALRMLGYRLDELNGQRIHGLIHHSHEDGTPYRWEECPTYASLTAGTDARVTDEVFWRADGTCFPVEYVATPLREEDGTIAGTVEVFRDISERRTLQRLQSRFVSTVSHELRTPLTSIQGYLEVLIEGEAGLLSGEQLEYAQIAHRNSRRLQDLIGDLLTISRLEAGGIKLKLERVQIGNLVEELHEELLPVAGAKDVRLEVDGREAIELRGDRGRLKQAVGNLLSNAIKFSPPGAVVRSSFLKKGKWAVVEVADAGPGIPRQELPKVGERFFRASTAETVEGTGLGLAITAELVQQHGGGLECESMEGEGSTFRLRLPLERP